MSRTFLRFFAVCGLILMSLFSTTPSQGQEPEGIRDALKNFQGLDKSYSPAPLWTWNDLMTEEAIGRQLGELKEQGVQQVFVHARSGLMTSYLTDDWFRMWDAALKKAESLDMNIWIYDENGYPSGFAGGLVYDQMPESRDQGLMIRIERDEKLPEMNEDLKELYLLDEKDQPHLVTAQMRKKGLPEKADYVSVTRVWGLSTDKYAGKSYVDLLQPGVTEKFLDITLGAYKKHFGDQFGKRIPGSFTDEPRLARKGNIPWSANLAEQFEARWGYSLEGKLSQLVYPTGDWRRTRYHFYTLLNELFIKNWGMKYADYCEKNGLEFTGHVWEHAWPYCRHAPDNMAFMICQHRPGIDMLIYRYDSESTKAQFGNVRSVKEVASTANQAGRKRTICELYGASGWQMSFSDYKCYADWIMALGVNTIDEHFTPITIRGARKYDHPPYFSDVEPWWQDYHILARYNTRLCGALSSGQQINHIVVLEPTTTVWMYQKGLDEKREEYGEAFQKLVTDMELAQAEFDLLSENVLKRLGREGKPGKLAIGQREYDLFILPPHTENLDSPTVAALKTYLAGGGRVLCCGEVPELVDGQVSDEVKKLAASPNWKQVTPEEAVQAAVDRTATSGLAVKKAKDDQGILFHHRRQMDDGQLVFLVNTSNEHPTAATLTVDDARSAQAWDAFSGKVYAYPATVDGKTLTAQVEIPPCGSLLLSLPKEKATDNLQAASTNPMIPLPGPDFANSKSLPAVGPLTAKRLGPNVLTLDFADVSACGETKEGMAVIDAQNWVFQKNGFEKNPWDVSVQWRDELMKHPFAPDSGFTATYRFMIEGKAVPTPIEMVIERADLYEITCNGKPVRPTPGKWWLDRSFGIVDLSKAAKVGPNEVTITMKPMTIYGEVANAYLIGDFTLEPSEKGFLVKADRPLAVPSADSNAEETQTILKLSWKSQGLPFYAKGVVYEQTFDVPAVDKSDAKQRYFVELPSWSGSIARVSVNGRPAGHIFLDPQRCEVTSLIQPGKNRVQVEIVGTMANTLGPHHMKEEFRWYNPSVFGGCPFGPPAGKEYQFYDYGLWAPIQLNVVW